VVRALDGFDFYASNATYLSNGVTALYITPAVGRLIAGQGAVVKTAGEDPARRVLSDPAAIHGSITAAARDVQAFCEPPTPPPVDVGMANTIQQLPKTLMGAILALRELNSAAKSGVEDERYGPFAASELAALMRARTPWYIEAGSTSEIRALVQLASDEQLPLIVGGAQHAGALATELAAAGARVVYQAQFAPNRGGVDRGKSEDAVWPTYEGVAALVTAGVPVAITSDGGPSELRFAAALASRGGVDPAASLRAITLTPAELFGAASRVGSLAVGKDADLCVLSGDPLASTSSVLATWVDGELAWSAHEGDSVVIEVEELHVGDGEVLSPGQVLLRDGKIAEVGPRVAHPAGARVVRGAAAMPGIVDALGHLGLEGSGRVPGSDFQMSTIVAPGDPADRRVARHGVTTVVLSPRGPNGGGAPILAYKPAADDFDDLVISDPAAIRMRWGADDRLQSGDSVRGVLEKAAEYKKSWDDYEKQLAAWKPAEATPSRPKANLPEEDDEENGDAEEDENGEEDDDEEEVEDPDPVTGVWLAEVVRSEHDHPSRLRLQLVNEAPGDDPAAVTGSLRCASLSEDLVHLSGTFAGGALSLSGTGGGALFSLSGEIQQPEKKKKKKRKSKKDDEDDEDGEEEEAEPRPKLVGEIVVNGAPVALEATLESEEVLVAALPDSPEDPPGAEVEEDEGKPKQPKLDPKLEPFRRAMEGRVTVVVDVDRADEILACVETFGRHGIQPVLLGAADASKVAAQIAGRVRGVLPPNAIVRPVKGTRTANVYADLQTAGIPVAFSSNAEEGAIDLPVAAAYAVSRGMSPGGALRALTADAAEMMSVGHRVGRLATGLDGDVLVLDGPPLEPSTRVVRAFVNGDEVK
jgi:imidazolonepropionase-like amidohydrolase